jgi:methylenetetrahydrofolate dehydrogenase (NADP+) / methenyltetrahydrofolate cyclohydrolase
VTARILDGKAVAAQVRAEVAGRVEALSAHGVVPGLAAVLVGDDPASKIFVGAKQRACEEVGIGFRRIELGSDGSEADVLDEVRRLNDDPSVSGIIVQLPLPAQVSDFTVQQTIAPEKDVDGLGAANLGRAARGRPAHLPATPGGIVELLVRSGIRIAGTDVTIVGRSELVGLPLAVMLVQRSDRANATVTVCHRMTRDLAMHTRTADILVVATGIPGTITADMVKPGAAVVDVGISRENGRIVGDVAFEEVREVAAAITPVPGGVGPMTVAMLLLNTVGAAEAALRHPAG